MLFLGGVQKIKVTTVQPRDDGIAQIWKDIPEMERELPSCSQKIKGKCSQSVSLSMKRHNQIQSPILVPGGTEIGLVSVTKGHMVFERNYLESTLPKTSLNPLLQEKCIRVCDQGQPGGIRNESFEDLVPPVTHVNLHPPWP